MPYRLICAGIVATVLLTASLASGGEPAADAQSLDGLAWLEGTWIRETDRGQATETWLRVSDDTLEGTGSITTGGKVQVFEHLRIERFAHQIFYTAKPLENPYPVPFLLVEHQPDMHRLVFENLDHDFPQRLIYTRDGETGLKVRVEAEQGGEIQGFDVHFVREAAN